MHHKSQITLENRFRMDFNTQCGREEHSCPCFVEIEGTIDIQLHSQMLLTHDYQQSLGAYLLWDCPQSCVFEPPPSICKR